MQAAGQIARCTGRIHAIRPSLHAAAFKRSAVLHSRSFRGSRIVAMAQAQDISVNEASELVSSGAWNYLDVRTKEEFADGHPPGARNIPIMNAGPSGMAPNESFLDEVKAQYPDPAESQIAVGCKAGPRAARALAVLSQAGYQNLNNVVGGFTAWQAAGLPVEK